GCDGAMTAGPEPRAPPYPALQCTNTLRFGGGIGESFPFTDCQITSLSGSSGVRSASEKSHVREIAAPAVLGGVFSSSGTPRTMRRDGGRVGGARDGVLNENPAASYWLIGGSPRISSIVRSTPDVE